MLKAGCANTSEAVKKVPLEGEIVYCPFYNRPGIPVFKYYMEHPEYSPVLERPCKAGDKE